MQTAENTPNNNINTTAQTPVPVGDQTAVSPAVTAESSLPETPQAQAENIPPPSSKGVGSGPSGLFYIIFGLTLFVFLGLSAVVILSLKNNSTGSKTNAYPTVAEKTVSPTTASSLPTDPSTAALMQQKSSDEVGDIESDLKITDLSGLDNETSSIDANLP